MLINCVTNNKIIDVFIRIKLIINENKKNNQLRIYICVIDRRLMLPKIQVRIDITDWNHNLRNIKQSDIFVIEKHDPRSISNIVFPRTEMSHISWVNQDT